MMSKSILLIYSSFKYDRETSIFAQHDNAIPYFLFLRNQSEKCFYSFSDNPCLDFINQIENEVQNLTLFEDDFVKNGSFINNEDNINVYSLHINHFDSLVLKSFDFNDAPIINHPNKGAFKELNRSNPLCREALSFFDNLKIEFDEKNIYKQANKEYYSFKKNNILYSVVGKDIQITNNGYPDFQLNMTHDSISVNKKISLNKKQISVERNHSAIKDFCNSIGVKIKEQNIYFKNQLWMIELFHIKIDKNEKQNMKKLYKYLFFQAIIKHII